MVLMVDVSDGLDDVIIKIIVFWIQVLVVDIIGDKKTFIIYGWKWFYPQMNRKCRYGLLFYRFSCCYGYEVVES